MPFAGQAVLFPLDGGEISVVLAGGFGTCNPSFSDLDLSGTDTTTLSGQFVCNGLTDQTFVNAVRQ